MSVTVNVLKDQPLSEKTKSNYIGKIRYLETTLDKKLEWMMQNPKTTIGLMKRNISDKPATLAGYITPICKLYSVHPTFQQANKESSKMWNSYLKHYMDKRMEQYDENKMSDDQLNKMVLFNELETQWCNMRDDPLTFSDKKQHMHYILFAMFLNIKPKRADLGNVYVSLDGKIPVAYTNKNFILLNEPGPMLVLNEYKTSKIYGTIKEKLNSNLVKIIRDSLKTFPRQHLIVSAMTGMPYDKNNSYGTFVRRAFDTHFNRAQGVSLWRRVYVGENVDWYDSTNKELRENARLSGQSVMTQLSVYRTMRKQIKQRSEESKKRGVTCLPKAK